MKPYMRKGERSVKISKLMISWNGHLTASFFALGKYMNMNANWSSHVFLKIGGSFDGMIPSVHSIISILCVGFFWFECVFLALKMGGEPRKQEPKNCEAWKARKEIWKIMQKGKVTSYLERLNGFSNG